MTCRDFIYWLHGAFELEQKTGLPINAGSFSIAMSHLELAKKNRDDFFEQVCFIEGILSLLDPDNFTFNYWNRINRHIEEYLDSIFTQVTSSESESSWEDLMKPMPEEKTLEDFIDEGIIKVEYQTYDIDGGDGFDGFVPPFYGPRFCGTNSENMKSELSKSNHAEIPQGAWHASSFGRQLNVSGSLASMHHDDRGVLLGGHDLIIENEDGCSKINPFDLDEEESEMSKFQITAEYARKRIAEWPQWKRDIMEAEDKLREKRRQEDLEDDRFSFGRGY